MSDRPLCNRKSFLTAAGLGAGMGALALQGLSMPGGALAAEGDAAPAPANQPVLAPPFYGLNMGVASYSLRNFSLDQSIEITKRLGVTHLTLKDMHLRRDTTAAERQAAAQKIADAGLVMAGGGVIYMKNDEADIRSAFEYARDARMPVIVGVPPPEAMPLVDKMVKEFDIPVAIHNHGPGDQLYPSPMDAWKAAADYDERIGICIDFGHTVRNGEDEIAIIDAVKDRLYDVHIKDVSRRDGRGQTVEVGRGVIDIAGVLKKLVEIRFPYHVALEYEKDADQPEPGMVESFAYIRGVLAGLHV